MEPTSHKPLSWSEHFQNYKTTLDEKVVKIKDYINNNPHSFIFWTAAASTLYFAPAPTLVGTITGIVYGSKIESNFNSRSVEKYNLTTSVIGLLGTINAIYAATHKSVYLLPRFHVALSSVVIGCHIYQFKKNNSYIQSIQF